MVKWQLPPQKTTHEPAIDERLVGDVVGAGNVTSDIMPRIVVVLAGGTVQKIIANTEALVMVFTEDELSDPDYLAAYTLVTADETAVDEFEVRQEKHIQ